MRRGIATAAALTLTLLLAPSAQAATYEQVGTFSGTPGELHPLSLTQKQGEELWPEELQLGAVGGMAINYTGAGGVPKGTLYAITNASQGAARVARFNPDGSFSEAWSWEGTLGGAPKVRCGPEGDPSTPNCPPRWDGGAARVDVDVDQATGNVFLINSVGAVDAGGPKRIHAYNADGTKFLAEFGEQAPAAETFAQSPGKLHDAYSIAVGAEGHLYVNDRGPSFSNRLMEFEPQTPGNYESYVYAGQSSDITLKAFTGDPVADAAGDVYLHNEERVFKFDPDLPANPPLCEFKFPVGANISGTVDPLSGEYFTFSFSDKKVHVFSSCNADGKFAETQKFSIAPPRSRFSAMVFDPSRKFEAGRPAGVLYGASPSFEGGETEETPEGKLVESAMGYVFAGPKTPTKPLTVTKSGSGTGKVTSSPAGIDCGATCTAEFNEGEAVTLSAQADAGSEFKGWSGSGCSGTGTCVVTMSEAKAVTAEFSTTAKPKFALSVSVIGSGGGKVTSTPTGIDCGSDCSEEYEQGATVTLQADPDPGSEFSGFSGACTGTGDCEVTMTEAKAVTATFEEEETEEPGIPLTVALEGTGSGTVTSDTGLISCTPFCSDEYAAGTKVTLTATPAAGSVFYSWRYCDAGGVNGRQCTLTVDKAKTVKATFTTTNALEFSRTGTGLGKVQSSPGGILCLANCQQTSASFREGTEVTLKPTPAKHFHFVGWSGDCSGSGACQLTMGEDHDVQAQFAEDPKHLLTLSKAGGGAGTVKSSVAGINCGATCSSQASAYYEGEVLELTATPGKGSAFGGWSGAGCSGTGTCTVTMDAAKSVTAEFK